MPAGSRSRTASAAPSTSRKPAATATAAACAPSAGSSARVFTAAQLCLTCTACGVPTFNTTRAADGEEPRCEQHDPLWPYFVAHLGAMRRHDPESTAMYRRLSDVANYGATADQEALDWAYANVDMSRAPR